MMQRSTATSSTKASSNNNNNNNNNNGSPQVLYPGQSRRRPRQTTTTNAAAADSGGSVGIPSRGGRKSFFTNGHNNNHAGGNSSSSSHKVSIKSSIMIFAFFMFALFILVLEWNILAATNHQQQGQQHQRNQVGDVTDQSSPKQQYQQQEVQQQQKRHLHHHPKLQERSIHQNQNSHVNKKGTEMSSTTTLTSKHDPVYKKEDPRRQRQSRHQEEDHQQQDDPHQNDKSTHIGDVFKPITSTKKLDTTTKNKEVTYLYDTSPPDLTLSEGLNEGFYPDWIINYLKWHQEIRQTYPDMELFTNPNAPNLLVRTCLGMCGGLHDRLGQLPWDLYLANQTQRILLLSWQRPRAIEHFLIPSHPDVFNWTMPKDAHFGFDDMNHVRDDIRELFFGYEEANPTKEFWDIQLDLALQRASPLNRTGEYSNEKLLRHRILGHLGKDVLEQRLRKHYKDAGIIDYPERHVQLFDTPIFGKIFWELFFQPSKQIKRVFTRVMDTLQLQPNNYTAVHCRVRHPKNFQKGQITVGKNPNYPADKTGLPWDKSSTKLFAMNVATHALQCATETKKHHQIQQQQQLNGDETTNDGSTATVGDLSSSSTTTTNGGIDTIYFMSDSNDLVRHVAEELFDPQFVALNLNKTRSSNGSSNNDATTRKRKNKKNKKKNDGDEEEEETIMIDPSLYQQVLAITAPSSRSNKFNGTDGGGATTTRGGGRIVARDVSEENAHIDRQKGRSPPAYYATFVDLLVAMHAECVIFGIGYYAEFAAHISGTTCEGVYQKESWGQQVPKHAYTCV